MNESSFVFRLEYKNKVILNLNAWSGVKNITTSTLQNRRAGRKNFCTKEAGGDGLKNANYWLSEIK